MSDPTTDQSATEDPPAEDTPAEDPAPTTDDPVLVAAVEENSELRAVLGHYVEGDLTEFLDAHITYKRDGSPVFTPPASTTPTERPRRSVPKAGGPPPPEAKLDVTKMSMHEYLNNIDQLVAEVK